MSVKILHKFLPLFLIAVLLVSLIYEASADTPTYDEPANMAAAFDYASRNDFRIYPDNPPLVKILAGILLAPFASQINFPKDLPSYQDPQKFDLYAFGTEFLYRSNNNPRMIIFLTRLPNILFTVALATVVYLFARALYGSKAGLMALFLYTLDPNIRGHGHILAFDIPLTFFIVLILYLTYLILINCRPQQNTILYIVIPLLFALSFLTKFTTAFFFLIYALGILSLRNITLKTRLTLLISIAVVSFTVIWAFGLATNYNRKTLDYNEVPIIASANINLSQNFTWQTLSRLPLPYFYKTGLQVMYTHNVVSQPAFLLGEVRAQNNWFFYFPISFLLKSTLPILLLTGLFIYCVLKFGKIAGDASEGSQTELHAKQRERSERVEAKFGIRERQDPQNIADLGRLQPHYFSFVIGFLFMFLMMLFSHINNVFRYLFPSYVLFILGLSQIINYLDIRKPFVKLSLIVFLFFHFLTSLFSFPYDLSYTNELTGFPKKGHKYLSDSEIDWGQDLERLAHWLTKERLIDQTITLSYLGTADPLFYGIKYRPLQFNNLNSLSGIVAVSAGNLTLGDWQYTSSPEYKIGGFKAPLDDLRRKTPVAVIGKSIFVYRF